MFHWFHDIYGNAQQVELENHDLLLDSVLESITSTITQTISQTMAGFKIITDFGANLNVISEEDETLDNETEMLKEYSINEVTPAEAVFSEFKSCQWLICNLSAPQNTKDIKNVLENIDHNWSPASVRWAKNPFAQGAQRISYHGECSKNSDICKIVVKEFKKLATKDQRTEYISIMETQCIAAYFADEFNKRAPHHQKTVKFLEVSGILQ